MILSSLKTLVYLQIYLCIYEQRSLFLSISILTRHRLVSTTPGHIQVNQEN